MRDDFKQKIKSLLSQRVGFKCSNPDCRHLTDGPAKGAIESVSIGEAAHICAASPGGPRYDSTMTVEQRGGFENGIWLCRNCAAMIDRDEKYYTVELLRQWKQDAEKHAEDALHYGIQPDDQNSPEEILTDDEKIVLYYLLSKEQVAVSKNEFAQWCVDEEIYDVNYDNAQFLLPVVERMSDVIQLKVDYFKNLLRHKEKQLADYKSTVDIHRRLSSYTIREKWIYFSDTERLLIAYSKDIKSISLGDRWKAQGEIASIARWEQEYGLEKELSENYSFALQLLLENEILYPSDWTSYGNAREYSFHKSAWNFMNSGSLDEEIEMVKAKYRQLP